MRKKTIAPEEPKFYIVKKTPRISILVYGIDKPVNENNECEIVTLSELKKYIYDNGTKNIECVLEYKPVEIETIVRVGDE